jgi:hypothetical protein
LRRLIRFLVVLIAVMAIAGATFAWAVTANASKGSGGKGGPSTTKVALKTQGTLATSPFGPGANIGVSYSCFPGSNGKGGYPGGNFGSVTVGDLQGTIGFGSFTPTCDDTKHTDIVFVPGAFVAGDAAANAFVCGFDCAFAGREIKLS